MAQGRKISDVTARMFRKEYEDGATLQDLVDRYGYGRATLSRAIVRVGGTMRSRGAHAAAQPILGPEIARQVRKDYEDGADLRELAKKYGVHFSTIRMTILRNGGTMRKGGGGGKSRSTHSSCAHCRYKKTEGLLGWLNA